MSGLPRRSIGVLDAADSLNGPTAIAKLPIAIHFNQVNRVRAAMGKKEQGQNEQGQSQVPECVLFHSGT